MQRMQRSSSNAEKACHPLAKVFLVLFATRKRGLLLTQHPNMLGYIGIVCKVYKHVGFFHLPSGCELSKVLEWR